MFLSRPNAGPSSMHTLFTSRPDIIFMPKKPQAQDTGVIFRSWMQLLFTWRPDVKFMPKKQQVQCTAYRCHFSSYIKLFLTSRRVIRFMSCQRRSRLSMWVFLQKLSQAVAYLKAWCQVHAKEGGRYSAQHEGEGCHSNQQLHSDNPVPDGIKLHSPNIPCAVHVLDHLLQFQQQACIKRHTAWFVDFKHILATNNLCRVQMDTKLVI